MCLICVELIKQRMTLPEAERASLENIMGKESDSHEYKLRKALKELNLEELAELLEEGTENGSK